MDLPWTHPGLARPLHNGISGITVNMSFSEEAWALPPIGYATMSGFNIFRMECIIFSISEANWFTLIYSYFFQLFLGQFLLRLDSFRSIDPPHILGNFRCQTPGSAKYELCRVVFRATKEMRNGHMDLSWTYPGLARSLHNRISGTTVNMSFSEEAWAPPP